MDIGSDQSDQDVSLQRGQVRVGNKLCQLLDVVVVDIVLLFEFSNIVGGLGESVLGVLSPLDLRNSRDHLAWRRLRLVDANDPLGTLWGLVVGLDSIVKQLRQDLFHLFLNQV